MLDTLRRSVMWYWDRPNRLCRQMEECKFIRVCHECGELFPDTSTFFPYCEDCASRISWWPNDFHWKRRYKILWRVLRVGPNDWGYSRYGWMLFFKALFCILIDQQYDHSSNKGIRELEPIAWVSNIDHGRGWHIIKVTPSWRQWRYDFEYDWPEDNY